MVYDVSVKRRIGAFVVDIVFGEFDIVSIDYLQFCSLEVEHKIVVPTFLDDEASGRAARGYSTNTNFGIFLEDFGMEKFGIIYSH
jgi:hypothetical protein